VCEIRDKGAHYQDHYKPSVFRDTEFNKTVLVINPVSERKCSSEGERTLRAAPGTSYVMAAICC